LLKVGLKYCGVSKWSE